MSNETNTHQFKKVMVIDDNHIDRYLAEMVMKSIPSFTKEIILHHSAKIALQYLESLAPKPEELPELIFLDIRMPEMDGFQFLESYNLLPSVVQQHCIIMMLTSSLNDEDQERAANNEFVRGFITKPLTRNKLALVDAKKSDYVVHID